jgi:hypothetical protein
MSHSPRYMCPACGFPGLQEPPWASGAASDEICVSCGIHFGYDDATGGDLARREAIYEDWRARWIARGCPWFSPATQPPAGWSADAQLRRVTKDSSDNAYPAD